MAIFVLTTTTTTTTQPITLPLAHARGVIIVHIQICCTIGSILFVIKINEHCVNVFCEGYDPLTSNYKLPGLRVVHHRDYGPLTSERRGESARLQCKGGAACTSRTKQHNNYDLEFNISGRISVLR